MDLEFIKIAVDERKRREPPPEDKRSLGAFFNDFVSEVSETMRRNARIQITAVINDIDAMRPRNAQGADYEEYRMVTGHLSHMRDDIVNGGWKGAAAARQVLLQFRNYAERPHADRRNMLPRVQSLMP